MEQLLPCIPSVLVILGGLVFLIIRLNLARYDFDVMDIDADIHGDVKTWDRQEHLYRVRKAQRKVVLLFVVILGLALTVVPVVSAGGFALWQQLQPTPTPTMTATPTVTPTALESPTPESTPLPSITPTATLFYPKFYTTASPTPEGTP